MVAGDQPKARDPRTTQPTADEHRPEESTVVDVLDEPRVDDASSGESTRGRKLDRRALRRAQTREEILDLALTIMSDEGVAGLTMARLAREMSIQPPSLYKYFPSLLAIYDALFRRGQQANLEALRSGMTSAAEGMEAVEAGMEATGRWAVSHPVEAELLFWRPVPGYRPTPDAFAPALEIIKLLRGALTDAAAAGQVHPDAASDEGMALLSSLHFGILSQHLANDPESDWENGRFTRLHPRIMSMFVQAYPAGPGGPANTQ